MTEKTAPVLAGLRSVPPLTNPVIISDVHLAANKPKTIMAFLRFLKDVAPRYAELVILGDYLPVTVLYADKHCPVVAERYRLCASVAFVIVYTGVIATEVNADDSASPRRNIGEISKSVRVRVILLLDDEVSCMARCTGILDHCRETCNRLV